MRACLAALAVVAAVLGCGAKGPPVAPELVRPLPPSGLRAVSTAGGIELRWSRPSHYTGGRRMRDLGSFEILRATGGDPAAEFVLVKRIELDDQTRFRPETAFSWTDPDTEPGVRYRYRVVAVTLDDYRSAPATLRTRWRPGGAARDGADNADGPPVDEPRDASPPDAAP